MLVVVVVVGKESRRFCASNYQHQLRKPCQETPNTWNWESWGEFWRQKCELKYQLQHTAFPIAVTVYSCVMLLHFLDALDRSNWYIMFSDFGDIYRIYRVCKLVLRLFHFLFLSVTLSKIPWHQCDKYPTFINGFKHIKL